MNLTQERLTEKLLTRECMHEPSMKPIKIKAGMCQACIRLFLEEYDTEIRTQLKTVQTQIHHDKDFYLVNFTHHDLAILAATHEAENTTLRARLTHFIETCASVGETDGHGWAATTRELRHRLTQTEQHLEDQRTATYQAVEREHAAKKLLSLPHTTHSESEHCCMDCGHIGRDFIQASSPSSGDYWGECPECRSDTLEETHEAIALLRDQISDKNTTLSQLTTELTNWKSSQRIHCPKCSWTGHRNDCTNISTSTEDAQPADTILCPQCKTTFHPFEQRITALKDALAITIKWMDWWITQQECDCEMNHRCGIDVRKQELEKAREILTDRWHKMPSEPTSADPSNSRHN